MAQRGKILKKGPDHSEFASRLIKALEEAELSAAVMAETLQMATSTFYSILKNTEPQRHQLNAIAEMLGVNAGWLATGKGPKRPGDEHRGSTAYDVAKDDILQLYARATLEFNAAVKEAGITTTPSLDDAFHYRDQLALGRIDKKTLIKTLKAKYSTSSRHPPT